MNSSEKRVKGPDEVFCWSCGEAIKKEAVLCVHCGVKAKGPGLGHTRGNKSKGVAIALAVFFGFWAWLYTIREDWKKLVAAAIGYLVGTLLLGIVLDHAASMGPGQAFLLASAIIGAVIWLWVLLDRCIKPADEYREYPKE
jgi:uncharacterized membrane protein YeaQ/YmgE (transglycosylase-associated protein family)